MNNNLHELNHSETEQVTGGNGNIASPNTPLLMVPLNIRDALKRNLEMQKYGITQATHENGGGFEFLA